MPAKMWKGALIALAVATATATAAPAEAYTLYRSVQSADPDNTVRWSAANFGVSGSPPILTFYHFANDAEARRAMPTAHCFVKIDVGDVVNPLPGTTVQIGNADIRVNAAPFDQPLAFPWTATFDNNPAGLWGIEKTVLVATATNTGASRVAAAGFMSLATTPGSGVTVIDGIFRCTAT